MMANFANFLKTCLLWMVLTSFKSTGAVTDIPSPNTNLCDLYDRGDGSPLGTRTLEVQLGETDWLTFKQQIIRLPIAGRDQITLSGDEQEDMDTLTQYGMLFSFFDGFIELQVDNEINRDGLLVTNEDDLDVIRIDLSCTYTDSSSGTMLTVTKYIDLKMTIQDANDNTPVFTNLPYAVTIEEVLPVNTTVYDSVSANDFDANYNKRISYHLINGNVNFFSMPDSSKGYIMLANKLDYEALDRLNTKVFNLAIEARDAAVIEAERKTATTSLVITIADSDDLSPTFYHESCRDLSTNLLNSCDKVTYTASITSGQVQAQDISVIPLVYGTENTATSLRAFDLDKLNAAIAFRIADTVPPGYQNQFSISTSGPKTDANLPGRNIYTATLRQTGQILRSSVEELELNIVAYQLNDLDKYSVASVKFQVQPNNVNDPVVSTNTGSQTGYIRENVAEGATVRSSATGNPALRLIVTDDDLVGGDVQGYIYQIVSGTAVPFSIQTYGTGNMATIYATGPVDRESQDTYTFTVVVTEDLPVDPKSGSLLITVEVQDDNDNQPIFTGSAYTKDIVEADYTGNNRELLAEIRATDIDAGVNGQVSYDIKDIVIDGGTPINNLRSLLDLDPTTGNIFFIGDVTNRVGLVFVVTIEASDNAVIKPRTEVETLRVRVLSQGQNPPVFSANSVTTQESEAATGGSLVMTLTASDPDGNAVTYSIQQYNVGSDKFDIDATMRWKRPRQMKGLLMRKAGSQLQSMGKIKGHLEQRHTKKLSHIRRKGEIR